MDVASLDELSKKYYLDKNIQSGCHNYIPGYASLFDERRMDVKTVLEIGIGSIENGQMSGVVSHGYQTGNSLKCWNEYFPNAHIYGIDIYKHDELNTERIHTFTTDQSDTIQLNLMMENINKTLDIIIDDGSHIPQHQVISFMFLYKHLSPGGIEDINPQYIYEFQTLSIFPNDFREFIIENFDIKLFDTRATIGREDDIMMAFVRK